MQKQRQEKVKRSIVGDDTVLSGVHRKFSIRSNPRRVWILLSLCVGLAAAQSGPVAPDTSAVLGQIRVHGNRRFSASEVIRLMEMKTGVPLPQDWPGLVSEKILNAYQKEGFLFARMDSVRCQSTSPHRIAVDVWLAEGDRLRIGEIELSGIDDSERGNLFGLMDSRPGSVFTESALRGDIHQILSYYENRGHALAAVSIESLAPLPRGDKTKINVRLGIKKGPLVVIGSVLPKGNTLTGSNVILRETRLTWATFTRPIRGCSTRYSRF